MPRILITGADGQLGVHLAERARQRGMEAVPLTRRACDITDSGAVADALQTHRPDVVMNCAAWTDVDGAEAQPEPAFAANATGPLVLALACASRDTLLVHVSSDYVFDGASPFPLDEDTPPAPLSVYGASKLAGERAVRAHAPRHLIVRTSGLYGKNGPNFVLKVLRRAAAGEALRVVGDQVTAPTWTGDFAGGLLRLAAQPASGTFHLTNAGSTSWHGFATAALELAGYPADVEKITTAELATTARRPHHAVLDNRAWRLLGEPPLPHWHDALHAYVTELRSCGRLPSPAARGAG